MNMSFYSAAVGAIQQQQRMNVQSNNIANVNTHGFRAERASFGALMNRDVIGIDNAELPKGTGTRMTKATVDFNPSGFIETGRTFDFAINGDGFFALYDPPSEEISYTRDGAFTAAQYWVDPTEEEIAEAEANGEEAQPKPEWRLSDNEGRCVLDPQGNFIVLDMDEVKEDRAGLELRLGVFDYAIREGLEHADSCRFVATDKNGQLYLGTGVVKRGLLELSNTDLAQEFIKVIESQRAYSFCLKMVTTSDEIETTINGLR